MYSDTSKFATGSALYQIQNGQPKPIAYMSKRMPEAVKNYSITELEMCGLAIDIAIVMHLLKKIDFDMVVDHLAIMYIMKSKAEPATTKIKRLLELLSSYSFNLYYIKGKDIVLSDFLSRQRTDDSNPHEIIPICFSLRRVLSENYYKLNDIVETDKIETDKFLVQTRSQAKSGRVKVPEVHGIDKGLIPHVKPEHQISVVMPPTDKMPPVDRTLPITKGLPTVIRPPMPKPRIGQGRAGIRRKSRVIMPTPMPIQTPAPPIPTPALRAVQSLPEAVVQSQEILQSQNHLPASLPFFKPTPMHITQTIGTHVEQRLTPPHYEQFLRPPPRPPDVTDLKKNTRKDLLDLDMDRNINFEENSLYQEGIISETYERLEKSYIQEPSELNVLVDTTKSVQEFLPKQTDIDKSLDIIKRKVLKRTHLPPTIKEIQAGYLTSPYFKDLYLYLAQNKLPSKRSAICKVETLAERFILLTHCYLN